MTVALAVLAFGILLGFALYLVILLSLIRKRGFGEGSLIDLPDLGLSLRCPAWWTVDTGFPRGSEGGDSLGAGASLSSKARTLRIRTGNHSGLVTLGPADIEACRVAGGGGRETLKAALERILRERKIILDDPEVRTAPIGDPGARSPRHRAWVASNGREEEERRYLEMHLMSVGGCVLLLTYANSVLYGYLDAFYLEKLVETVRATDAGPS